MVFQPIPRFVLFLLIAFLCNPATAISKRLIQADFSKEKCSLSETYSFCVGAGRANEGLRADWQEQLSLLKKDCGFKYIRFHGLLSDDMGVCLEENGKIVYNFQYIDKLFDFLVKIKVRPFVEFGFMPQLLSSGSQTIFWWKGNVTPPASYEEYGKLIYALTSHWKERYGEAEILKWFFEVWNEPDLGGFFTGTKEEYFLMYKTVATNVKKVHGNLNVGGPAVATPAWIPDFLKYCSDNKVPIDFVSAHNYGVEGFLDEFGKSKQRMSDDSNAIIKYVNYFKNELVLKSESPNLPIHFTEWSSSYSSRDPIHDTYQNATYVLNTLKGIDNKVASMSYWTFTDIFEEAGPAYGPFHGGFGLMNLQGLKKPTYFAYKYINALGKIELQNNDSQSWVCKDGNNLTALFWDFTFLKQGKVSNQDFYSKIIKSSVKDTIELNISNLKNGQYLLELYRVGYKQNDIYSHYMEFGAPSQLNLKEENSLSAISADNIVERKQVRIRNNSFIRSYILSENDICFLRLSKL